MAKYSRRDSNRSDTHGIANQKVRIAAFAGTPPPTNGFTLASSEMIATLRATGASVNESTFSLERSRALRSRVAQLGAALRCCARIVLERPDFLYLPVSGGLGQLAELPIVAVARAFGLRIVLHHHTCGYIEKKSKLVALISLVAGARAKHLVQCAEMGEALATTYGPCDFLAISNLAYMELPEAERKTRPRRTQLLLGFLGNLTQSKGSAEILQLALSLPEGTTLEICGTVEPGPLSEQLINDSRARTEIVGPHFDSSKFDVIANWDLLLFPSHGESEGRVVHEALSVGVPVAMTPVGCLRHSLASAESVFITANIESFASDVLTLVSEPQNRIGSTTLSSAALRDHELLARKAKAQLVDVLGIFGLSVS